MERGTEGKKYEGKRRKKEIFSEKEQNYLVIGCQNALYVIDRNYPATGLVYNILDLAYLN